MQDGGDAGLVCLPLIWLPDLQIASRLHSPAQACVEYPKRRSGVEYNFSYANGERWGRQCVDTSIRARREQTGRATCVPSLNEALAYLVKSPTSGIGKSFYARLDLGYIVVLG